VQWFARGHRTSPMTNESLPHLHLVPNYALRGAIAEFSAQAANAKHVQQSAILRAALPDHVALLEDIQAHAQGPLPVASGAAAAAAAAANPPERVAQSAPAPASASSSALGAATEAAEPVVMVVIPPVLAVPVPVGPPAFDLVGWLTAVHPALVAYAGAMAEQGFVDMDTLKLLDRDACKELKIPLAHSLLLLRKLQEQLAPVPVPVSQMVDVSSSASSSSSSLSSSAAAAASLSTSSSTSSMSSRAGAPPASVSVAAAGPGWSCGACTFENAGMVLQCVICHAQRPSSPALPSTALASFPAAQAQMFPQAFHLDSGVRFL
jgi:hypothetical protein